jgi:hypothetical protein
MTAIINLKPFSKIAILIIFSLVILFFLTSCDPTLVDVYTKINADSSGTRTIELAVKTEYLQKGDIALSGDTSIYDKILSILPKGKIETSEKEGFTHFKSTADFEDVNFLQHVSIDNYSETAPDRFYAKMDIGDFFFRSNYAFHDYIDMKIDQSVVQSQMPDGDYARIANLFNADNEMFKITYQVKFPVKITESNADVIGDDNIAIWNMKFGETRDIVIKGKKIKYLSYILVVVLGIIGIFIIFLAVLLAISRRKKRISYREKPKYSYDNYFKKDGYFRTTDDRDD